MIIVLSVVQVIMWCSNVYRWCTVHIEYQVESLCFCYFNPVKLKAVCVQTNTHLYRFHLYSLICGQVQNTSVHTLRKVNRQMDIQFVKSFSTTDSVLEKIDCTCKRTIYGWRQYLCWRHLYKLDKLTSPSPPEHQFGVLGHILFN